MKGRRPWHKRYHEDALNGYMGLTPEERGIYTTCLDLIYMRGGPLAWGTPVAERWLSGWCGCSGRLLRSVIPRLVEKGKLRLLDGQLNNDRAMRELGQEEETSSCPINSRSCGRCRQWRKPPNRRRFGLDSGASRA